MKIKKNRVIISLLITLSIGAVLSPQMPDPEAKISKIAKTHEVYINIPSPCHAVQDIKIDKIFLKKVTEKCAKMVSRTKVRLKTSVKKVKIYLENNLWQEQSIQGVNLEDVHNLFENSQKLEKMLQVEQPTFGEEAQKIANQMSQHIQSEAFQKKLSSETERLKRDVFHLPIQEDLADDDSWTDKPTHLRSSERLYLFISSSIPLETLRIYAKHLDHFKDENISFVLRGFIGGMKKAGPTLEFVSQIIVEDPNCRVKEEQCPARQVKLVLDPLLFKKYGITRVPALVYVPNYQSDDPQGSEGRGEAPSHYTVYGDSSMRYLIEEINRTAEQNSLKNIVRAFSNS